MTNDELHRLVEEANMAFWDVIVKHFPKAKTGDLSPWTTIKLHQAQQEAVEEWIGNNFTTRPSDIAPGYRFKLLRDVDRFPNFRAQAGLTGTVTFNDDSGIRARMDDHILGAEHWDNQIHWDTAHDFAWDTVPS
jgi:hypothetical protein